jgi:hypothetical protein
LNCGKVYSQKKDSRIVINKLDEIKRYIIPHFSQYTLMNRKQQEFIIWCDIINMIENGEHLTEEGLDKIRKMRIKMR